MKRQKLLMAAVAGMTLGAAAGQTAQAAGAADEVRCFGVNSCGHHSKCSVKQEDLDAVKLLLGDKDYQAKFGKSEVHGCGSHAKCGASSQILNWTPTSPGECKDKGGLLIDTVDGKRVAKKA
jgi:hypothetical protein